MRRSRAKCPSCDRVMPVQPPAGGDGGLDVFPRHKDRDGRACGFSRAVVNDNAYVRRES